MCWEWSEFLPVHVLGLDQDLGLVHGLSLSRLTEIQGSLEL